MKTKFKWIWFNKIEGKPKTQVWECYSNESDEELGLVKWYGPWRQYCFFPETSLLFNPECMREVAEFVETLTKKHKAKKS